ncbi:unnamed protein product [Nesidiocoris tenuis]|uniref:Glucuronosyltransferase n=1 Tax=Nesidiocoris tenuis TaxID=355587 RepID=A0A6H5HGM1_9HEMI|nr:unnamed protein product [Nesidiocoris tenuis]
MDATILMFLVCHVLAASGARILGLFPHFGVTHWYVFRPLMEELARRGHQVTVVSPFPRESPTANYEDVSLIDAYPPIGSVFVNLTEMESVSRRAWQEMIPLYEMAGLTEDTIGYGPVLDLLNRRFDLTIAESFNTDVYLSLAYRLKTPLVLISSHQITSWAASCLANPQELSYTPHILSSIGPGQASFADRLQNAVESAAGLFLYETFFVTRSTAAARSAVGDLPDLGRVCSDAALLLVATHFTVNGPRPWNPNVVEVGGINVLEPKALPKDLQQLLDNSHDGVIYFSMGTVLKASTLSESKRSAFLKTFAGLKQTVLWKWDGSLEGKPANVHTSAWYPQRDIFAHKNVVLFISHCGNLGVNEAVHEGIPIICIPMFGDQPYNAKSVQSQGMADILDFYSDLTYEKIRSTVNQMLNNPSYKRNAKRVSKAYRDRPMTPLQTAVYWVEYVLRHDGAPHMRSLARHMPWYAYYNYDVMLFLHFTAFALLYVVYRLLKFLCCSLICAKSSTTQPTKNTSSKTNKTNKLKKS